MRISESRYPIHEQELLELVDSYESELIRFYLQDPDDRLMQCNGNHWEEIEYFPRHHFEKAIDLYWDVISGEVTRNAVMGAVEHLSDDEGCDRGERGSHRYG